MEALSTSSRVPTLSLFQRFVGHLKKGLILCCGLFILTGHAVLAKEAPTLSLFPRTVVENIKETGETAKVMEQNLQVTIQDLEKQMELYTESNCKGAEADQGCGEIAKQMADKYAALLDQMQTHLPKMEHSVRATSESLETKLRQELGKKLTPRQLQKLSQTTNGGNTPSQTRAGRLSDKFRKYYELVSLGPNGSRGSLATVASEIYLDSKEVLDLITLTRDEIERAKLMIELNQIYGLITPEMFKMVAGVKEVIFGESEGTASVPAPVKAAAAYRSPLEK